MKRIINLILILLLGSSVFSQNKNFLEPIFQKKSLQKVWAHPQDGGAVTHGYFYEVKDDSLILTSSPNLIEDAGVMKKVNLKEMKKIQYRHKDGFGRGALLGGLSGLAIGSLVGFASGVDNSCPDNRLYCTPLAKSMILGIPLMIAGGMVAGLSTGTKNEIYLNGNSRENGMKIYVSGTLGARYRDVMKGVNATIIMPNQWGISLGYKVNSMAIVKNLPSDYSPGLCFFEDCYPNDFVHAYSLKFVKEFSLPNSQIRLGIEAGPSWVNYQEAKFIKRSNPWFGPNYSTIYETESSMGLALKTKVGFPLSPVMGLEVAAVGNINELRSFYGLELGMNLGQVR